MADVFMVTWTYLWWVISRVVDSAIREIAGPVRNIAETASKLSRDVGNAAGEAGKMPMVGDNLRRPLDTASQSVNDIAVQAQQQVSGIELTASAVGLAVFVLPVLMLLAWWLPVRVRYARRTAAAAQLLTSPHALDLLALRALTNMSLPKLAKVSDDPVGKWRAGDPEVTRGLAQAELRSLGMKLPTHR